MRRAEIAGTVRTMGKPPPVDELHDRVLPFYKEEFFPVASRKTWHARLDQLQVDLDCYLEFYNRQRAHQGYRTQGRAPYQAFLEEVNQPSKRVEENADLLPKEVVA